MTKITYYFIDNFEDKNNCCLEREKTFFRAQLENAMKRTYTVLN